ncbi:MAG: hypothetical protein AB9866_20990 [Syntrophobacteraceae bacterium]
METPLGQICAELEEVHASFALTIAEVLGFPGSLKRFLRWMIVTRAVDCEQVAGFLGETEQEAQSLIDKLVARGLIEHVPTCGVLVYRVCLTPRRLPYHSPNPEVFSLHPSP